MYSIIIPVFNEEKNINILVSEIDTEIKKISDKYEIIVVDDGSTDSTPINLDSLRNKFNRLKVFSHKINRSQSAAIHTGVAESNFNNIILMDGDMQNDPKDFKPLIDKYNEGYDFVIGNRVNRKDNFTRTAISKIANFLIRKFTSSKIQDQGCALKIFKKELFEEIDIFGDFHRLFAIRVSEKGYKVAEIATNHRARKYGESKYGLNRIFYVIIDIVYLKFVSNSKHRIIYFFGMISLTFFLISFLLTCIFSFYNLMYGITFNQSPFPLLAIFFLLTGIIIFLIGIIAQLLISSKK